jgi:hypothetical protein
MQNHFLAEGTTTREPFQRKPQYFCFPNPGVAHWVCKLTIHLGVYTPGGGISLNVSDWAHLLTFACRPPEWPRGTQWQDYFQLDELHIILTVLHRDCLRKLHGPNTAKYLERKLLVTSIALSAPRVDVQVWGFDFARANGRYTCTKLLAAAIKNMGPLN